MLVKFHTHELFTSGQELSVSGCSAKNSEPWFCVFGRTCCDLKYLPRLQCQIQSKNSHVETKECILDFAQSVMLLHLLDR